ncbi:MAG: LapA family protein [candidate division WOR-3 bacterium]|nr:LapA family protein [candidate division WOR-3 bacterium]MCX7948032.1 LapA family protein [candidate division WOR-3 bacterium]MDW8151071.1 LapA family protein [candidate division WOR-3 bacterium]
MTFLRFIVILFLSFLLFFFLLENTQNRVSFHIFGDIYEDVPLWIVIFISFIFGFAFSSILGLIEIVRSKMQLNQKEKKIRHLENELDELRKFLMEEER